MNTCEDHRHDMGHLHGAGHGRLPWADDADSGYGGRMEITGDRRILPSRLAAGDAALRAVGRALHAAEDVARRRGWPARLSTEAGWIEDSFDSLRHLRVDGRAPEGFAPHSGLFATTDGWVRTHGNYPHHRDALLRAVGLPPDADRKDLTVVLARGTADSVVESVVRAGGVAARVRTAAEWSQHPAVGQPGPEEGRVRGERACAAAPLRGGSAARRAAGPWDATAGSAPSTLPLTGFRVVSFTRVIAGPVAARLLGALGAQVVRIDPPHLPELVDQRLDTDFGVDVRTADLRRSVDRACVDRLLAHADGLILGYRPGGLDRLGLGTGGVLAAHPHLATAVIRAWDPAGAWAERRGFDSIVQAASGIAERCGDAGRPGALPAQILDHVTGYRAAGALMRMWAAEQAGAREFALADVAADLLDFVQQPVERRAGPGSSGAVNESA
ncbi:MAG TPA: CoA transferase, partial [Brevibacterium sp.]|nr:CoA transferase [Brevibacterium sp.]